MRAGIARVAAVVLLAGSGVLAVPVLGSAQQAEAGAQNEVRLVARHSSADRVEFGLQQRLADGDWDVRLLPARRFFPVGTTVGRWLTSSPLVLRVEAAAAGVEPDAVPPVTQPPPAEEPPAEEPPAEEPPADEPPAEEPQTVPVTVSSDVPSFNMTDVATGRTVNLRSVVTGATPLLFWLWSPY